MINIEAINEARTLSLEIMDYLASKPVSDPAILPTALTILLAGLIRCVPKSAQEQDKLLKVTCKTLTEMVKEGTKND